MTFNKFYAIIKNAKQTKYTVHRGVFFRIFIPFFVYAITVEFDKMQIPYSDSIDIPNLYMVCLATTGICVFVR